MSDDEVLLEEFEVLESIYPTEFTKLSSKEIQIEAEPEDLLDGADPVKVYLRVSYPDGYPDVVPNMSLEAVDGELEDGESERLLDALKSTGEENLGMAMTFTLVSFLREQLSGLVVTREEERRRKEAEEEARVQEEEDARTRGTPVTVESFMAWKAKFDAERARMKQREEEERHKGLTPKEREEWKRMGTRLSGRQLFEKNQNLEDESLVDDGAVSVDPSQYERTQADDDEDDDRVTFSDSD
ncbi:RWD-domain-containing protein [Cylindrobasidium torrendii FP15055 ss-10]|uniref:RWD-domain-containing protein n=1 Tax=Cylindrobasidium torrendii FP15055 ss-10 TaxID=1314674 RepID=A0A0D7B2V2_9AGAR|nr:RWD-domain-containing protein [Cylindrobasidium torrendii FP15055 ss-10]